MIEILKFRKTGFNCTSERLDTPCYARRSKVGISFMLCDWGLHWLPSTGSKCLVQRARQIGALSLLRVPRLQSRGQGDIFLSSCPCLMRLLVDALFPQDRDWLRNLWGPVQNKNAVPLFKNYYGFWRGENRALGQAPVKPTLARLDPSTSHDGQGVRHG